MSHSQRHVPRGWETVLIVADSRTDRSLLGSMLRRSGYRVLEARHSGQALLNCLGPEPIHLVLTEFATAEMAGRELVSRLTRLRPGLKALYITRGRRHEEANAEADPHLRAPFTTDTLAWKVRSILDGALCAALHETGD